MNKLFNKKAFTLIELLIVIAIIGILFIVLISKVDFATDKAKATGVQTDFRSFQLAFDTVAKEHAGFNTFGWDTGDANQDGIRNSYDEGDNGAGGGTAQNGIQDGTEVFTGHKVYAETFTKVYSLKKNGTGAYDRDALNRLEAAINANLDPKLHITIKDDGEIVMANGAQDPWNKEYHGWYITNAEIDKQDRGAIVMYSDGANNEFGSEHTIENGIVTITVPGSNKDGKDDYSMSVVYTYTNGYGEVQTITSGFSNNQTLLGGNSVSSGNGGTNTQPDNPDTPNTPETPEPPIATMDAGLYKSGTNYTEQIYTWQELIDAGIIKQYMTSCSVLKPEELNGDLILSDECQRLNTLGNCTGLTKLYLPDSTTYIDSNAIAGCTSLTDISFSSVTNIQNLTSTSLQNIWYRNDVASWCKIFVQMPIFENGVKLYIQDQLVENLIVPEGITSISQNAFKYYSYLKTLELPTTLQSIGYSAFVECENLEVVKINGLTVASSSTTFGDCPKLHTVYLYGNITALGNGTFDGCTSLENLYIGKDVKSLGTGWVFYNTNIKNIYYDGTASDWAQISIQHEYGSPTQHGNAKLFINNELATNIVIDNVDSINPYTFFNYRYLESLTIGDNVKSIGEYAFKKCSVQNLNLGKIEHIGNNAFFQCDKLNSINLPNTLQTLGSACFRETISAKGTLVIPSSVTIVSEQAFYDTGIEKIVLSEGVETIEEWAFANCSDVKELVISSTVTSCGVQAFGGFSNLAIVRSAALNPPSISTATFVSINANKLEGIYIPSGSLAAYSNATGWSTYSSYLIEQ